MLISPSGGRLNRQSYVDEAIARMPTIETKIAKGLYRHDVGTLITGRNNVGIELGVASGTFASQLLRCGTFEILFGVDSYSDLHDTNEYKEALRAIGLESRHKLLRLTFDEALDLFPDSYFDLVYIDGFAHTGEEGGKTLVDWYQKLKVGGILCGDDYHEDWPLVMWAVNHLAFQLGCVVSLTERTQDDRYSRYPTWFIWKERNASPAMLPLDRRLVEIAHKEKARVHRLRNSGTLARAQRLLRRFKNRLRPDDHQ